MGLSNSGHRDHVFDYVIVGAGAAGAVLANRLSEDPRNQVLLQWKRYRYLILQDS